MTKRTYGHTKSGTPITDELIDQLADEAERGYDRGACSTAVLAPPRPP